MLLLTMLLVTSFVIYLKYVSILFLRMVVDVSADMGSSGVLSEDINNPCRETELRKMFDKLKINLLPEYMCQIQRMSETDKTIDVAKEKKRLNAMFQVMLSSYVIVIHCRHYLLE